MSRGLTFQVGGFYHIYNRGTEKREIFLSEADHQRFVALLYSANSVEPLRLRGPASAENWLESSRGDPLVDLCAYCLMPNHFHLLLHESSENGISRFLQKFSTAYTMYFNTRYERKGVLFEGKFKARDANEDRYLKYLISYIHLNPVSIIEPRWKERGLKDIVRVEHFLETYRYSSYQDFRGKDRLEKKLLMMNVLPEYFVDDRDFQSTINDWLTYQSS